MAFHRHKPLRFLLLRVKQGRKLSQLLLLLLLRSQRLPFRKIRPRA